MRLNTICGGCNRSLAECTCPRTVTGRIPSKPEIQNVRPPSRKNGWRIDILIRLTGLWAPYTSRTQLVDKDLAESLSNGLKRQHAPGRLVEVINGVDNVREEWS